MERLKDPSKCGVGKGRGSHLPEGFADNYLNLNNNYFFPLFFTDFFATLPFFFFKEGDIDNTGVCESPITHNQPLSILPY